MNSSQKIKLFIGIFIPLIIVIFLAVLSMSDIGYHVEKETKVSVNYGEVIQNTSSSRKVLIQTISLNNDFFLPRKFELPGIVACLNDKDNIRARESLVVEYSEGEYLQGRGLLEEVFLPYTSTQKKTIDIKSNTKKQVKVYVTSKYVYGSRINSYQDFDEILLVEVKGDSNFLRIYSYCQRLTADDLVDAVHISLINKPSIPLTLPGSNVSIVQYRY